MTYYATEREREIITGQEQRAAEASKAKLRRDDEQRRNSGKMLLVRDMPQNGGQATGIRVQGQWLERFGFSNGDKVRLYASEGEIKIVKEI